ncbi:MAG: transglutaminase family protein [Acidobacteriota bacterium]|nr:transglutaminase family protein [Acidobacteriota bacterium]
MTGTVRYEIEHVSRYRYAFPARECVMLLCLKPRSDGGQRLRDFRIETSPPASLTSETDCFGNVRHVLYLHREHDGLEISARSTVEPAVPDPLPGSLGTQAWREILSWGKSADYWDFTRPSALARPSALLDEFVSRTGIERADDPLEGLLRLSRQLHRSFSYVPGSTSAASPIDDILQSGRGVCQDYAHVMITVARSWGIPSRYVSGYLSETGQPGEQAVGNATHAWVECRLPELGWIGFDPTNVSLVDQRHVRIAVGRDYKDVSPTQGVRQGGGETNLEVDVQVIQKDAF